MAKTQTQKAASTDKVAAAVAEEEKTSAGDMAIRITAKTDGFRRCGVAHPATPTDYPADAFSDDDMTILENEPRLVVERL